MTVTTEDILQHFGVPGMKWGVRRDRNKSGGADGKADSSEKKKVTPANEMTAKSNLKKRRSEVQAANALMYKETGGGLLPVTQSTAKKVNSANRELVYAKQDYSNAKALNKANSKPKSKAQLKLEEKYRNQGMSKNEAIAEAYKSDRTRKILMTTGALALTAGAAYAAYKLKDYNVDKIIRAGSKIQTVANDANKGVRDSFYTASNKLDKLKYRGVYGMELKGRKASAAVVSKEIKVLSDIRQASPKNAQRILSDLGKSDPKFVSDLQNYMYTNHMGERYNKVFAKAKASLDKGIIDKNVYTMFNGTLVDHSPARQKLTDSYFKAMSKNGYNALKDVNDSKYSGYKAINPIIAFNTSGKVSVVNIKQLTDSEIKKAGAIGYADIIGRDLVKAGAIATGAVLGSKKLSSSVSKSLDNKIASSYRKEHPNTTLSNTEIVRMLERSRD